MISDTLVHLLRDNYLEAKIRGKKSFLLQRQQLLSLAEIPTLRITPAKVQTNIVIFDVSGTGMTSDEVLRRLRDQNVIGSAISDSIVRLVTHMDVTRTDCEQAVEIVRRVCAD